MAGHALQSLRDSGYTLPAAIGEVIDNSLEANANRIQILLVEGEGSRGKRHVHQVIAVDDGDGMPSDILQHYLQVGFSTRYMSTTTIGKYGVGAKLAALNFGRRIDVWSNADGAGGWEHVCFDLDDAMADEAAGRDVGIDPPDSTPIPEDVRDILPSGTGTVVVWSKVERLEQGRWAADVNALRVDVEKELARMFRKFLEGGITIEVNGRKLQPHDPLFLMSGSWADARLHAYYNGKDGAELAKDLGFRWPENKKGEPEVPQHFPARVIADEPVQVPGTKSDVRLVVTVYPPQVVRKRGAGRDKLNQDLRVPENEGAISFVRLGREINYTNVPRIFPRGVEEPDRFIGIEVSFTPDLDPYFGVRNVKRGVEPHYELRDALRARLQKYVMEARTHIDEIWGAVSKESREHENEHSDTAKAAADVNRVLPKGRVNTEEAEDETARERELEKLAEDTGRTGPDAKKEYVQRVRDLPFVVESVDWPGTNFIDVQHFSHQVIIRLNTRHVFYQEMWQPIKDLAEATPGTISGAEANSVARRTIEALTLLLIAYGKAESMDQDPHERFGDLRMFWGQFLSSLMTKVKGTV